MKKVKKISKYIISVLTAIFFLFTFLIIIVGIKANKSGEPAEIFGYSYSIVVTDSMEPTIKVNDIILFKKTEFNTVKPDDIIVFYSAEENIYIVHRVKQIDDNGNLVTKGDNPYAPVDPAPVTEDNFYGIVVYYGSFLSLGKAINQYRNIVYLLIILIFLMIIVSEVFSIIRQLNERNKLQLENEKKEDLESLREKIRKELYDEMRK